LGVPAAGLGALMSVYTGVLLSATSTPLWAATSRHLPALFGATAGASAGAALSLVLALSGAPGTVLRRLDRFGLLASAAQLALAVSTDRQWRRAGVSGPLDEAPLAAAHRVGVLALGIGLPLLVQAVHILGGRHSRSLGLLASLATLGGAYAERAVIVFGGNRSADRPEDTFRLAQKAQ
ncbi:MAG TPA: polysulfide reductase NrfD, partial [Chloroflexota bacterium]|nr:polysulfide reductase NrfD [Chloroflexota bacterium]